MSSFPLPSTNSSLFATRLNFFFLINFLSGTARSGLLFGAPYPRPPLKLNPSFRDLLDPQPGYARLAGASKRPPVPLSLS